MRISDWSSDVCSSDLVGHSVKMRVRAAHLAGVLQLILAVGVLIEVVRRFVFGSEPESLVMMAIAFVALIANTSCLLLISKHREGGAHMKASWIFSANDVVINLGVITAGALAAWTGSNYPDLIIGTIRAEEHTSALQSLMRIPYAVFCLKKT